VNLSENLLAQLFCALTGNTPSSAMALGGPAIVAMDHRALPRSSMTLPQHAPPVLNNPCSDSSLPSPHEKIIESVAVMLKMLMHTQHHQKLLHLCPLTMHAPTGVNTDSGPPSSPCPSRPPQIWQTLGKAHLCYPAIAPIWL